MATGLCIATFKYQFWLCVYKLFSYSWIWFIASWNIREDINPCIIVSFHILLRVHNRKTKKILILLFMYKSKFKKKRLFFILSIARKNLKLDLSKWSKCGVSCWFGLTQKFLRVLSNQQHLVLSPNITFKPTIPTASWVGMTTSSACNDTTPVH